MIYDASKEFDLQRARTRLDAFAKAGKTFELTEKKPKRSYSQNRYLHLILSFFAKEYGDTPENIKQVMFKQIVNPEIFKTEFLDKTTGQMHIAYRSTSELDSRELTAAIDNFRNYSNIEAGIYLPEPSDLASMHGLEMELGKSQFKYQ